MLFKKIYAKIILFFAGYLLGEMMQIHTRFSGELAATIGKHRFTLSLPQNATVGDLLDLLCQEYPDSTAKLRATVQIIAGRHVTLSESLTDGQEVAFLLPMAGG